MKTDWKKALQIRSFRIKFFSGALFLIIILGCLPVFFNFIEHRAGAMLRDPVLNWLRPRDLSIPIFLLIWASCLLLIFRLFKNPETALRFLWAYNLLTLVRMACIGLISLIPPGGLIPLADPITNLFYGAHYITHDLFFSGHTATVFLIFLCLKKKGERYFTGIASLLVGIFLLIQHVHYTMDVLAAPVFAWLAYRFAVRMTIGESRVLTSD